ncbi:extracellular solute-binding protein [Pseudokineococcus basanitobsidens]|uniref:Extracellular solute-binding protein n=1 Tax=Pseudokineococcus basanitobsidens TaxID=1926649 RepID=A0ABU8RF59_9ACTN
MNPLDVPSALRRPPGSLSRRGFLGLAGAAAGTAALTSCGASIDSAGVRDPALATTGEYDGPPVDLDFWNPFTGGDGPTMARLVQQFTDSHPSVRVRTTSLLADDMYAKVLPAVAAQEGPQVAIMHLDQLPTYALRGTIVPLDDAVAAVGLTADDYVPGAFAQAVYRGQRWGLPLDVFSMGQYWSRSAFAAAGLEGPVDGTRFAEDMAALQDSGVESPLWVTPGSWQLFVSLLTQFGGSLFDADGRRATFGSDAGVEALAWMRGLVTDGVSPQGAVDARAPFKNGSAALLADLPAAVPDLQDTAPDLDWGLAPLMTVGQRPATFANSHHFVLTDQSQADERTAHAALTFVTWMSRNATLWAEAGNTPAAATARASAAFQGSRQAVLASDDVLDTFSYLPLVPSSRDVAANSYQRAVAQVVLGQAEPAAAADFAQRTAQAQLDDLNRLYGI